MDTKLIIEIIKIVAYVVLGGLSIWYSANAKLKGQVGSIIEEAEEMYKDTTKAGGLKHEYVVTQLYNLLPTPMRIFFTKEMMGQIVDNAFEAIESYAKKQLDKIGG